MGNDEVTRIRTDRRRVLAGGAELVAGTVAFHKAGAQSATARSPEHAIFTEFSSELKLLKAGWNTRVFTHTDARRGKRDSMRFRYRDHHPGAGLLPLQRRVRGRLHERGKACGDDHGARTGIGGLLPAPDQWSKSRVESRYARRRQRRPQRHVHRKSEHREPHCERVRSVSGNRQDRGNGAGTSIGKQSGANLLAGLHPEFRLACDGQNWHSECVTHRVECSSASRDRASASARVAYLHHRNDAEATCPSATLADLQLLIQLPVHVDPASFAPPSSRKTLGGRSCGRG